MPCSFCILCGRYIVGAVATSAHFCAGNGPLAVRPVEVIMRNIVKSKNLLPIQPEKATALQKLTLYTSPSKFSHSATFHFFSSKQNIQKLLNIHFTNSSFYCTIALDRNGRSSPHPTFPFRSIPTQERMLPL